MKKAKPKLELWMSLYHHRHGTNVGLLIADGETDAEDKFHKWWLNDGLEEDRDDEYFEVFPAIIGKKHPTHRIAVVKR